MNDWEWELPTNEVYRSVLHGMRQALKTYLGYPPFNRTDNKNKRNQEYLKHIESYFGRTLQEMLDKVGMEDYGETAPPVTITVPHQRMIHAIKLMYGVEMLNFGSAPTKYSFVNEWVCTTDMTKQLLPIAHPKELEALLKLLDGEILSRMRRPKIIFLDTGNEHVTLDSLREELLIIKLSGL